MVPDSTKTFLERKVLDSKELTKRITKSIVHHTDQRAVLVID